MTLTFLAKFHIVSNFSLQCDALLGFDALAENISLHPKHQAPSYKDELFYATSNPKSILNVTTKCVHFEESPLPRVNESLATRHLTVTAANAVDSKCSVSVPKVSAAFVIGDQNVGPTSARVISLRVKDAPVGSFVLSHPDTSKVKRLAVESTLLSVRKNNVTSALVANLTGSSITLRDGVNLGSVTVIDATSLQDSTTCVAVISSQSSTQSPEDIASQLEPHVQVMYFPDMKCSLINLLVTHREAFALPGEPLGVTNRDQHHIELKPDTRPVYVQSYRLPHSQ
ncbi:hypothetical protein E2C01_073374 [Portunus trituberculatus]|uniref:Uncharacterized protein n=1 Tax=Portunus trituberculatus TaxID=210409 RepID=A0A5B7I567_PORTR|nr:hypothetical protein [Portunus trituberculatus]